METLDEKLERIPKNIHVRRYYKARNTYTFAEYYLRCSWERTDVCLQYSSTRDSHPLISVLGSTFSLAVDAMLRKVEEMGLSEGMILYLGVEETT
ncbi:MAG: hypothetical protein ACI36Z_01390 [Alloprevotella sp.]